MKDISIAMKEHLQQDVTTLSTCWYIKRTDGKEYFFTDNIEDLTIDGNIYLASSGFDTSNIKDGADGSVDNLEIKTLLGGVDTAITDVLNSEFITEIDMKKGLWNLAYIEIFKVNREDLSMGKIYLRSGTTGEVRIGRVTAATDLRSTKQRLQQKLGDLYQPLCSAKFGDAKCNVDGKTNLANHTFNGTITSVISQHSWIDTSLNQTNSSRSFSIQNIAAGSTTFIQSNGHTFSSGDEVRFSGISGSMAGLNGQSGIVTFIDANNFSVNINSTGYLDVVVENGSTVNKNTSYSNSYNATFNGSVWNTNGGSFVGGGVVSTAVESEYFQGGIVTFTSGENEGLSMEVQNYYPQYVYLSRRMIGKLKAGDTYTISSGCDFLASTCFERYNNIDCFRGFNLIPGNDSYMAGV